MNEEMFTEIQEMVLGLIEKHSIDKASKEAQQQLQKKFGNGWNVIIGKGYGAAVTAVKVKKLSFKIKCSNYKFRERLYSFTTKACMQLIFGSVNINPPVYSIFK